MAKVNYEIVKQIGVISESKAGWTKELNLISWNDREPKYDLRDWAPDHEKNGQGHHTVKKRSRRANKNFE